MESFSTETFVAVLSLIGMVLLLGALLSGLIERSGVPQVAVFLGLGAVLGPAGMGMLDITLQSPVLRVVATLSLVLVLFTDAITLNLQEIRRYNTLTLLILGPGTLLTAALVGVAGWGLLGLAPAGAAILGAALASSDPVLLRGLLRRRDIPPEARLALRLESGLNDAVLLPVVLVAIALLESSGALMASDWARLGIDLLLLGPAAGVLVGLLAVATLDLVRRRIGMRRDYESIYSLGVAFTAFAAAEAVHGSGFLAAFAAGITVAALDVELCDCFLEYGETTAEMALLFTFVLFGSSLIWEGLTLLSGATLLFAAVALLVRPLAFVAALAPIRLERRSRVLIGWFGPRGLASLLLVLLPVFEGVPGSDQLFALCSIVVLFSVALHGGTPMLWRSKGRGTQAAPLAVADLPRLNQTVIAPPRSTSNDQTVAQEQVPPSASIVVPVLRNGDSNGVAHERSVADNERITIGEMRELKQRGVPVVVLDVRAERNYNNSALLARSAVRLPPDHVVERARELNLPQNAWLIAFCA
jgi:NhaP-type Na+/H+ or K+/H+ antiporter